MSASSPRSLRVAVVGCSHGTLDDIYATVARCDEEARSRGEPEIDLVLCCGDFQVRWLFRVPPRPVITDETCVSQAMRNTSDLQTMACPVKYRALGHFHQYYAERKRAPKLTIVIGGNHESSGYMWELCVLFLPCHRDLADRDAFRAGITEVGSRPTSTSSGSPARCLWTGGCALLARAGSGRAATGRRVRSTIPLLATPSRCCADLLTALVMHRPL